MNETRSLSGRIIGWAIALVFGLTFWGFVIAAFGYIIRLMVWWV